MMVKVNDIATCIENFAPRELQESYDNAGLQVGNPEMEVTAVLLTLDITDEVLNEAMERGCNMIVSHHPLIFRGMKSLTGADITQQLVIKALLNGIAVYSAHTNLDSVWDGVSHEIARKLSLKDLDVLQPQPGNHRAGLGVVGITKPVPKIEFLRKVKDTFNVKALRYSSQSPVLVIRKVAVCGGAGASLISESIRHKADILVTGDVKYHDFTSYGNEILIADIGHYESELCSRDILSRVIREQFPDLVIYLSDSESNPIKIL